MAPTGNVYLSDRALCIVAGRCFWRSRASSRFDLLQCGVRPKEARSRAHVTQQSEQKLLLGQHQVDVTGGVSIPGGCGRCCWSTQSCLPFLLAGGRFAQWWIWKRQDDLACPTIEHEYRFEKVDIRQGMMGAPTDLPMRAQLLWHQVQLIAPFWMGKTGSPKKLVLGGDEYPNEWDLLTTT